MFLYPQNYSISTQSICVEKEKTINFDDFLIIFFTTKKGCVPGIYLCIVNQKQQKNCYLNQQYHLYINMYNEKRMQHGNKND